MLAQRMLVVGAMVGGIAGHMGSAVASDPHATATATEVTDFARALGIDAAEVLEARAFDLRFGVHDERDPTLPRFIIGRHREHGGPWTFPKLVVYAPCKGGLCLYPESLGQAATRVAPIAVVDLDAPRTELTHFEPLWDEHATLPRSAKKMARPALLLAAERQRDPARAGEGDESEMRLVVVPLRLPKKDWRFETTLEAHSHDPTDAEMRASPLPGSVPVGTRLAGLVFVHDARGDVLTVTQRPIDSRWNGCLESKPWSQDFVRKDGRYAAIPPLAQPTLPCH